MKNKEEQPEENNVVLLIKFLLGMAALGYGLYILFW